MIPEVVIISHSLFRTNSIFSFSEIDQPPVSAVPDGESSAASPRAADEQTPESPRSPVGVEALSTVQRNRFHFFQQQRVFISNLTEIAERLRYFLVSS